MLSWYSNNFIQRQVLVTLMIRFSLLVQRYIKGAIFFAHSYKTVISNNNERIVQAHRHRQTWKHGIIQMMIIHLHDDSRAYKFHFHFPSFSVKTYRGGFSLVIMTSFSAAFFYRLHTAPKDTMHNITLQLTFGKENEVWHEWISLHQLCIQVFICVFGE